MPLPEPPSVILVEDGTGVTKKNFSEADLADEFKKQCGLKIKYVPMHKHWYLWNGVYWAQDHRNLLQGAIKDHLQAAHPKKASNHVINSIVSILGVDPSITTMPADWNKDSWALNCDNVTIDLRTGQTHEHKPEDMITKKVNAEYSPDNTCPQFDKFLDQISGGNDEIVNYIWQCLGYTLTGDTSAQCLFILHGTGKNGKSTFINTIRTILGEYSRSVPSSTFTAKEHEGIPNDIAMLKDSRLVCVIETDESKKLSEALVKQTTGGDPVSARFMRGEFFEFVPQFKIWFITNHLPYIYGSEFAIWRRIKIIPFNKVFDGKAEDTQLKDRLEKEANGILTRMVHEAVLCYKNVKKGKLPIVEPDTIREVTREYREDMDVLSDFFKTVVKHDPNGAGRIQATDLYKLYVKWCISSSLKPQPQQWFGRRLKERSIKQHRTSKERSYIGLTVVVEEVQTGFAENII